MVRNIVPDAARRAEVDQEKEREREQRELEKRREAEERERRAEKSREMLQAMTNATLAATITMIEGERVRRANGEAT